jgi:resuscitation-promoting factor RpfE
VWASHSARSADQKGEIPVCQLRVFRTPVFGVTTLFAVFAMAVCGPHTRARAEGHDWDAVAQCESGGNWSADTGNGYFGGLQFTMGTWKAGGGSGSPAQASRAEQIRIAESILATHGPGAWPRCGVYL